MSQFEESLTNVLPPLFIILVGILAVRLEIFPESETDLLLKMVYKASLPISLLYVTGWLDFSRETIAALVTYLIAFILEFYLSKWVFKKGSLSLLFADSLSSMQNSLLLFNYQWIEEAVVLLFEPLVVYYMRREQQAQEIGSTMLEQQEEQLISAAAEQPQAPEQELEEHLMATQPAKRQHSLLFTCFVNVRFICAIASIIMLLIPLAKPKLPYCVSQSFNYLALMSTPLAFTCVGLNYWGIIDDSRRIKNIRHALIMPVLALLIKEIAIPILCYYILKFVISAAQALEIVKILTYGPGLYPLLLEMAGSENLFIAGYSAIIGVIISYFSNAVIRYLK